MGTFRFGREARRGEQCSVAAQHDQQVRAAGQFLAFARLHGGRAEAIARFGIAAHLRAMRLQPVDERRDDSRDVLAPRAGNNSDSLDHCGLCRSASNANSTLAFVPWFFCGDFCGAGFSLRVSAVLAQMETHRLKPALLNRSLHEEKIPDFLPRRSTRLGRTPSHVQSRGDRGVAHALDRALVKRGLAHDPSAARHPRGRVQIAA